MSISARYVFRPGDAGYEEELAGFQTGFALRPELVVGATGAEEVRAAVAYAAGRGLPVGVQATGHGLPGAAEGGLLITTRRMDEVRIDPGARVARVAAGVRWGQVVEAAAPHGLAPLNGSAPSVGAVSYTLGGGLGILAREFGWAADHVRSLDVVTADGALRHVTAASDPELFGGLLGGGYGLGVVTALEAGLVPVARLYGGSIAFDGAETEPAAVLRAYTEWTAALPDSVTSSLAALVYPDMPALPPHLRGRYVLSVRVAFTGDAAAGERIVAPLRAIGPALSDSLREMPYTESPTIHSDPDFPHAYWGDGILVSALDQEAAASVLELTGPKAGRTAVVQINHLGGALAKERPNAVPYRGAGFLVRALYPLDAEGTGPVRALHARVEAALAPRTLGRAVNFVFGDGARTEGLYDPETRKRLARLKSNLDPANLFGRN
ncbi:FAD-dependent oxidoreductase [Streptomyces sp. Je 1-79]|uniref:FAD-binding oxidoreductase n=1 Tax=Streptomyces sp. Je 1-79 TaxID=2943847 RepID=UPI0021A7902B|nr:FAD-dependent oxidoreductase [Streptomyces sp. Je 1-79]MCT4352667.1 FAD-dependent oxidoreductase [Streptomyces sp. Je 1-79]